MADKPRRKRYALWPGATEYERRKAAGAARGLSPSQAIGKPKPGETPVSQIRRGLRRLWDTIAGPPKRKTGQPPAKPPGKPPRPPAPPEPLPEEPEEPRPPIGPMWTDIDNTPSDAFPVPIGFDELANRLGIGGDELIQLWNGEVIDPMEARRLLYLGYFEPDLEFDWKAQYRQEFMDLLGWMERDRTWDAWREWYEDTAA